jgi:hypothetical protein
MPIQTKAAVQVTCTRCGATKIEERNAIEDKLPDGWVRWPMPIWTSKHSHHHYLGVGPDGTAGHSSGFCSVLELCPDCIAQIWEFIAGPITEPPLLAEYEGSMTDHDYFTYQGRRRVTRLVYMSVHLPNFYVDGKPPVAPLPVSKPILAKTETREITKAPYSGHLGKRQRRKFIPVRRPRELGSGQ